MPDVVVCLCFKNIYMSIRVYGSCETSQNCTCRFLNHQRRRKLHHELVSGYDPVVLQITERNADRKE